jgi:small subunit ribosomal protein S6
VLVRNDVEVEGIAIPDEDVRFERIELAPLEEERDESRERQLGLVEPDRRQERMSDRAPPGASSSGSAGGSGGGGGGGDEAEPEAEPEAAAPEEESS